MLNGFAKLKFVHIGIGYINIAYNPNNISICKTIVLKKIKR